MSRRWPSNFHWHPLAFTALYSNQSVKDSLNYEVASAWTRPNRSAHFPIRENIRNTSAQNVSFENHYVCVILLGGFSAEPNVQRSSVLMFASTLFSVLTYIAPLNFMDQRCLVDRPGDVGRVARLLHQ